MNVGDLRFAFDVQGYLHLRGALTPDEVQRYHGWIAEVERTDVKALNSDNPEGIRHQVNRPLSRLIDADLRFALFLDHPAVLPWLEMFLSPGYRHIDNDLYYTYPDYPGGGWHRGVHAHPTGHIVDGRFVCPMVKVFYCMTDVAPGEGEFVVVPGSHRTFFDINTKRMDLPAQHVFDDVAAGDIIIFNEALLHNGRPNKSQKTRKTIIMNFGPADAGVWAGYRPLQKTLDSVTGHQRAILCNGDKTWFEPAL